MIHHFRKGDVIYSKTLEQLKSDPIIESTIGWDKYAKPNISAPGMNFKMMGKTLVLDRDIHININSYDTALNWVLEDTNGWQWYTWMIDWNKSIDELMSGMEIE